MPTTADIKDAVTKIFEARKTHDLPKTPAFPVSWAASYGSAAIDSGVHEQIYGEAQKRFLTFWSGLSW